jgi:hypothetical protein
VLGQVMENWLSPKQSYDRWNLFAWKEALRSIECNALCVIYWCEFHTADGLTYTHMSARYISEDKT